jgi:Tim44-like domain
VFRLLSLLQLTMVTTVFGGIICWSIDALARGGGGQHYSGGGGGGSGGGGGDGIGMLIYLIVAYPEVGVPVAIVVVIASVIKHARNPDQTTARAVKRLERSPEARSSDLSQIKSNDPKFDVARFINMVEQTDLRVQEAWTRGDMSTVRSLVSDGLLRRFETQLAIMRSQGVRNAMADHRVLATNLWAVERQGSFDTIHVVLKATARDTDVDAKLSYEDAVAKAARVSAETYTEIWSFVRRCGALTGEAGGVFEGRCPNCGAEFEMGPTTRCEHCEALINSGEYDWVLAEITQPEEWRPVSVGNVSGLAQLVEQDPAFSRQTAEDRGSYLFWRWVEALVLGDARPLRKVADPVFVENMTAQISGNGASLFKIAVGSVDLVACEPACADGRDRFHVKVLWSSASSLKGRPLPAANLLTISRKTGAVDSGGMSYARCPECQGPLSENDSPVCEYCGANLAAGELDWVLEAVRRPEELRLGSQNMNDSMEDARVEAFVPPDMGSRQERTLLLMRMAAVVMADGVVTKAERKLLKTASKRWGVPLEAVDSILRGEVDPDTTLTMQPANPQAFLAGLVAAALVDGRVDRKEERLLLDVGRNLGLAEVDTKNLINTMAGTR